MLSNSLWIKVGTSDGESARTLLDSDADIFIVGMGRHSITNVCQIRPHTKHEGRRPCGGIEDFVSRKAKITGDFRFTEDNDWKSASVNKMTEVGKSLLKSPSVPLENRRVLQLFVPYSSRGRMMLMIGTAVLASGES